jgi:hypothetical protein
MNLNLQVTQEYNPDLGKYVWTLSRPNGDMLIPSEGIQSINYVFKHEAHKAALAFINGEF